MDRVVPGKRVLIVTNATEVGRLAGAIAWGIRDQDDVVVEALGSEAMLRAAAAVDLAEAYLAETEPVPPAGMSNVLVARPKRAERDIPGVGPRSVLVLRILWIRRRAA